MNSISHIEQFYNNSAAAYAQVTMACDMSANLKEFTSRIPAGAIVVDAGCGSGRDTDWFLRHGYPCYSYDASQELQKLAQALVDPVGIVHCHRHTDLKIHSQVDGIWASASLLFLNDEDLEAALRTFERHLKPGGVLYASFKHGNGWRQDGERWFRDLRPEDGTLLERLSGLTLETVLIDQDTLGRNNQWNAFLLRKPV